MSKWKRWRKRGAENYWMCVPCCWAAVVALSIWGMKNIEPQLTRLTSPIPPKKTKAHVNLHVLLSRWHVFFPPFAVMSWLPRQPSDHLVITIVACAAEYSRTEVGLIKQWPAGYMGHQPARWQAPSLWGCGTVAPKWWRAAQLLPRVQQRDQKRFNRLIKRANSVCGCPLVSMEVIGERRATILANTSHLQTVQCCTRNL